MTPRPPLNPFWSFWATAGIAVLGAAFQWGIRAGTMAPVWPAGAVGEVADGIFRFSLLILTPAMVLAWLAMPIVRDRINERFGWTLLGMIAMLWTLCVGVSWLLMR